MPNELREAVARAIDAARGPNDSIYDFADAAIAAMQAHLVRTPATERTLAPAEPDVLREALRRIELLGIVPLSRTTGDANNGKQLIIAKSIARLTLAATEPKKVKS